ncbi:MAG: DUF2721 domain-containing protein [Thermoguttaceae bacterium]|jgi:hypothetical protein|nr:DUF2721 domain-containing protein [Thermoguttaceae bacterium]
MLETLRIIQSLVAPVVVISANGLLCLALYNRLAAVVSRMRTINKERFDLLARLSAERGHEAKPADGKSLETRLHVLDELGHQLFERARLIRDSLVCLLVAVLAMLACSLALGLEPLSPTFGLAALALFVVGIVVMMAGIVRAIQDLGATLDPLRFEHDMIEASQPDSNGAASGNGNATETL